MKAFLAQKIDEYMVIHESKTFANVEKSPYKVDCSMSLFLTPLAPIRLQAPLPDLYVH